MSETFTALITLSTKLEENNVGLALECLLAATLLETNGPYEVIHSNFLLGELLIKYAADPTDARQFLTVAMDTAKTLTKENIDISNIYFKSLLRLSEILPAEESAQLLSSVLQESENAPRWQLKILFRLMEVFPEKSSKDKLSEIFTSANISGLRSKSGYLDVLLSLSNALAILKTYSPEKELKFNMIVDSCEEKLASVQMHQSKSSSMKIFLHCLRISKMLSWGCSDGAGRKSGKSTLRQLHQDIVTYSQLEDEVLLNDDPNSFRWIQREELTALGYLITVIHSMHFGNIEKAIKYSDRTLKQVEKPGGQSSFNEKVRMITLEYLAQCRIIVGEPLESMNIITELCHSAHNNFQPQRISQLHSLIAFLALNVNQKKKASEHFHFAYKSATENKPFKRLCILLTEGKPNDQKISSQGESIPIKAIGYLIHGLSQLKLKDNDSAKRTFRDGVKISNAQDLKGLTAIFLMLLGEVFISTSSEGCLTTVSQARQMALKIPNESLVLWASKLVCEAKSLANENLESMQIELRKLEAKRTDDIKSIMSSKLAQELFNWKSLTTLPLIQKDKVAHELLHPENKQEVKNNHAMVDLEIDQMISKMESNGVMGPPSKQPIQSAQSPLSQTVPSPRPPQVMSPNYQNVPSPYNAQIASPMSQVNQPHSPFQPVHSPMNSVSPHPITSPQPHQQNRAPISPYQQTPPNSVSPKISPHMMIQQQQSPNQMQQQQPVVGYQCAVPMQTTNFTNGQQQPQLIPELHEQQQMTKNYNPFSHTNLIGTDQPSPPEDAPPPEPFQKQNPSQPYYTMFPNGGSNNYQQFK